ncbi:hypothetical protein VYU27_008826 [Nannochloropsis oceanica]
MTADSRPSRTRRYVYGGLLAAVGVAVALALVFTVGGAGQKKDKAAVAESTVAPLDTDVNIKDALDGFKPVQNAKPATPITTPKVTVPVTGSSTDGNEKTFNQADADYVKKGILGDPFQAIATSGADLSLKDFVGENSCWPQDGDELTDAVENQGCELVVLANGEAGAYEIDEDIKVNRYVRVMGNPAVLPQIDAEEAIRGFTVGPGGFLELQFVRLRGGGGETRDRYGLEGLGLDSQVGEVRGGGVAVEPGALGSSFVGVTFIAVANDLDSVTGAIEDTFNLVGGRLYGGHVFVAAGTVTFFGCNFWDTTLLLPFTDQVTIGGDVLVVAGNAFFTGCTFTATLLFGSFGGMGFNVAVLGGNAVFTFCVIQAQGVAQSANGAGQVLFVGGGTMIVTGMDFRFASAILFFSGIGDFFVGGGVMIFTGVTIENTYPILAAYGAGFYLAVGAGVMVETGVTYVQWNCPAHLGLTGASIFLGTGVSIHVGVPASFYGTTVLVTGNGGFSYNGAGYSLWLGCPIAVFVATFAFFGIGGLVSQPAGFMVYLGCPAYTPAALAYFSGLGVIMFLGAGSAVIGGSPVAAPAFKFASRPDGTPNYWIMGNGDYTKGIGYYAKNFTNEVTPPPKVRALSTDDLHSAVSELRAERRLSVSSISSLLGSFKETSGNRFLGADMRVAPTFNKEIIKTLSSWVPSNMIEGTKEILKLGDGVESRGPLLGTAPDSELDSCSFCGDGEDVSGFCTKFDSCSAMQEKHPEAEAAFHPDEIKFDPTHVVIATFNPTSKEGQKVDAEDFRDAFRSFFLAEGTTGVSVAAYSDEPDELFLEMMPKRKLSGLTNGEFPISTPLKAAFIVSDLELANSIKAMMEGHTTDEYKKMQGFVIQYMSEDGVDIGALDGGIEKVISIPAYNSPDFSTAFEKEASAAAGTNSIRLIDGDHTGLPLSHAAAGSTYTVLLANFPKNIPLTLQLLGSQEVGGVSKQTATSLASVKTDKDGGAKVTWNVPKDQALGDYYLKASDATGLIFGMTPTLEVTAAPKRKLWGPHMTL